MNIVIVYSPYKSCVLTPCSARFLSVDLTRGESFAHVTGNDFLGLPINRRLPLMLSALARPKTKLLYLFVY
jgi:hypothetical protein